MSNTIPVQSLPLIEKDESWRKDCVEAFISQSSFNLANNRNRSHLIKLYDYYNGKIHNEDYRHVLEPYGQSRDNFPVKIRNFNILKPSVDLLIGEKAKRPFNWNVIISSPDVLTIKEHERNEAVKQNLYQWFVNKLNDSGFDTGMESEEVELPQQIEEIFDRNWKDQRAIMAQKAINYLIPYLHWHEKAQIGWKDFLISGFVFTHRKIEVNEPYYEIINPIDVDFDKDPNTFFVEDGNWAVLRELVSRNSIIDKFRKILTDEQVERLESPKGANTENFFFYDPNDNLFHDKWDKYTELCTVYWKSLKRVGFRTYIDEFDDTYEEVVDEDYQFNPETDIDLQWDWINEVWQGYRVDGDMYLDIRPIEYQRSSIDNPSKCKLPINGRAYSDRNSTNISLLELGIPYQLSYNIFWYRLESAIAKSKDILAMLDINLVPEGWSMDKFMFMVEKTGIAWVNYQKEGIQFNPQHQGLLDMSIKTIDQYINLLSFIKQDWEYLSGISRQRMGEMSAYEGKATSQQAIIQSSHITEDYYRKYSTLEERDLQCMLDYSQLAWINGKKAAYVMPDGTEEYLNIDPDTYVHAEFGLFVKDAAIEAEKLQQMKALGQSMVQNGAPISVISEIVESDNFAELKAKISKAEQAMQQLNEQAQQMEQQLEQSRQEFETNRMDREDNNKALDRQNKIELELIRQERVNQIDDLWKQELERRKQDHEETIETRQQSEQERANRAQERLKEKEIAVKKTTKTAIK